MRCGRRGGGRRLQPTGFRRPRRFARPGFTTGGRYRAPWLRPTGFRDGASQVASFSPQRGSGSAALLCGAPVVLGCLASAPSGGPGPPTLQSRAAVHAIALANWPSRRRALHGGSSAASRGSESAIPSVSPPVRESRDAPKGARGAHSVAVSRRRCKLVVEERAQREAEVVDEVSLAA